MSWSSAGILDDAKRSLLAHSPQASLLQQNIGIYKAARLPEQPTVELMFVQLPCRHQTEGAPLVRVT